MSVSVKMTKLATTIANYKSEFPRRTPPKRIGTKHNPCHNLPMTQYRYTRHNIIGPRFHPPCYKIPLIPHRFLALQIETI
ncbi:hypothetical protein RJT34_25259 [Clitoria ternatea]|uniref:Uncharacterized protein n=1 Tax=Clitoria ternatea TaxID=43366 RepID=A0AAN9FPF5_CLITE